MFYFHQHCYFIDNINFIRQRYYFLNNNVTLSGNKIEAIRKFIKYRRKHYILNILYIFLYRDKDIVKTG